MRPSRNPPPAPLALTAAEASRQSPPLPAPATPLAAYNGQSPGPLLRIRVGETLTLRLTNGLAQADDAELSRPAAAQRLAGIGGLTQPALAPGASAEIRIRAARCRLQYLYAARGRGLGGANRARALRADRGRGGARRPRSISRRSSCSADWRLDGRARSPISATPGSSAAPDGSAHSHRQRRARRRWP